MTTPSPVIIPFREQLPDPLGLEFDNLTTSVNFNFESPLSPVSIGLQYADFLPDPVKSELQQLVAALNTAFTTLAAGQAPTLVTLQFRGEIKPQSVADQFEYFVATTNQGLTDLS